MPKISENWNVGYLEQVRKGEKEREGNEKEDRSKIVELLSTQNKCLTWLCGQGGRQGQLAKH